MFCFHRTLVSSERRGTAGGANQDDHLGSSRNQSMSQRKILVNAQVKAMISLLELSSNVVYMVIIVSTVKTSYTTLIQVMFLYMIILPYAFLMNTSHNKKRIVEYGWSNVLKNLIIKPNNSIRDDNNSLKSNIRPYHLPTTLQHQQVGEYSSSSAHISDILTEDVKTSGTASAVTSAVFSCVEPCSSKGTSIPMVLNAEKLEQEDEVTCAIRIDQRFISKMMEHIDDEPKYLDFFKDFVSFQEHCNEGKDPRQFQAEGEVSYYTTMKSQSKNPSLNRRTKIHDHLHKSITYSKCKAAASQNVIILNKELNADLKKSQIYKKEKRTHLLEFLRLYTQRDSSYDALKEQLINIEEEFINSREN